MKLNALEFKIRGYLRKGSILLAKEDLNIEIKRHVRGNYIGMSAVTQCARLTWMQYYHGNLIKYPENHNEHRMSRIFDYGHIVEWITVKSLELGGATITGTQDRFADFDGHFKGHCDGIIDDQCVGEIKSMNEDAFNHWKEYGTKVSHYGYYVQTNLYSYYSKKFDGILIATNKNTAVMDCEHIPYDDACVQFHREKVNAIVNAKNIFELGGPYIPQNIDDCTFCPLRKACHGT